MQLEQLLFELVTPQRDPASRAAELLGKYVKVEQDPLGGIFGLWEGENRDYTILLDAHVDEISFVVTGIDEKGFLKVGKRGGIDPRVLPACEVDVWGKEQLHGLFCSTPPHLQKEKRSEVIPLDQLRIDIGYPAKKAEELVTLGDKITFHVEPQRLQNGLVTGKALDDRAGVAALLMCVDTLSRGGQKLPCNLLIQFSEQEEIGGAGAQIDAFRLFPNEAIVVDVSFANYPGVAEHKCGKLGGGPMIGFSPVLSRQITDKLMEMAQGHGIPVQREIMAAKTGTNADEIFTARTGVACGMVSIPQRNMHTPAEVVSLQDVENTARLLAQYVMSGGQML